jgi:hypothetical protein
MPCDDDDLHSVEIAEHYIWHAREQIEEWNDLGDLTSDEYLCCNTSEDVLSMLFVCVSCYCTLHWECLYIWSHPLEGNKASTHLLRVLAMYDCAIGLAVNSSKMCPSLLEKSSLPSFTSNLTCRMRVYLPYSNLMLALLLLLLRLPLLHHHYLCQHQYTKDTIYLSASYCESPDSRGTNFKSSQCYRS